ncbi:S66 peptidase family protein [Clostridium polynesiense]|uniref:S66 peptidase family protein n=1 Tax=Clostridium polynesiense TaxID=1325933 RepID=UPI00058E5902|nr:LD-carboxypeptidase [Clostridium polynesiense]
MHIPRKINFNSTIGVISPASHEKSEIIDTKLSEFQNLGFKIKKGSHIYDKYGYLAGSDESRGEDFNSVYNSPEVEAVISYRGGYGTMRMMHHINYRNIVKNPKILCGYSDLTILLNYITDKYRMITFHAPMISSDFTIKETLDSFTQVLMQGDKPFTIINPENILLESSSDKSSTGRLSGGNLSLICASLSTPYEMDFKNKILFIEEVDEAPYAIDRMLTQLLLSGKLQQCKGFILGQFTGCTAEDSSRSLSLNEIFQEKLFSLKKPVLINLMSGHDNPKLTLPLGAKVEIDGKNKKINILEKVVQ